MILVSSSCLSTGLKDGHEGLFLCVQTLNTFTAGRAFQQERTRAFRYCKLRSLEDGLNVGLKYTASLNNISYAAQVRRRRLK